MFGNLRDPIENRLNLNSQGEKVLRSIFLFFFLKILF